MVGTAVMVATAVVAAVAHGRMGTARVTEEVHQDRAMPFYMKTHVFAGDLLWTAQA